MKFRRLVGIALCAVASCALADNVALTSNRTVGNQPFTGVLGMDFDVLSTIVVTHLGAFDSSLNGFAGSIQVGVFNRDTQTLVGPAVSLTGTAQALLGNSRFSDTPDFTLVPGRYAIVATGFNSLDLNGNLGVSGPGPTVDTGGGLIGFVGSSRFSTATSLTFPPNTDNGSATKYDAGTFQFLSAVPEVSMFYLFASGLCVLVAVSRRRRVSDGKLSARWDIGGMGGFR